MRLCSGQASFDPPGLTVAVKKDRAVESLLVTGNKFVVNILSDGNHKLLMKQLLKPFKPGEDRFTGLDIKVSRNSSNSHQPIQPALGTDITHFGAKVCRS